MPRTDASKKPAESMADTHFRAVSFSSSVRGRSGKAAWTVT